MTAPPAWRAISPVSRVTWCLPYWKVLVIFATLGSYRFCAIRAVPMPCPVRARLAAPGAPARSGVRPRKQPRRITAPRRVLRSAAQTELGDQRLVAPGILAVQVVEQAATAVHHHQQAATAVVVLLVLLEVTLELLDAGGEQGDLDFRGAGVVIAALVVFNDLAGVDGHLVLPRDARPAERCRRRKCRRRRTARSAACWKNVAGLLEKACEL